MVYRNPALPWTCAVLRLILFATFTLRIASTARVPPCDPCIDRTAINISVVLQDGGVFFRQMRRAMLTAAEMLKVNIQVELPLVNDPEAMAATIAAEAARQPSAMIVSVPDSQVAQAVKSAVDLGVPVFSVFSGADMAAAAGSLAHFGMDESTSCQEAAEGLFAAASNRSVTLQRCIALTPTSLEQAPFTARADCLQSMCEARNLSFEAVVVNTFDQLAARVQLDQKLQEMRSASELGGLAVLGLNAGVVKPWLEATRSFTSEEQNGILVGAYDLDLDLYPALDAGEIAFLVDPGVWMQGYMATLVSTIWVGTDNLMVNYLYPTGPFIVTDRRSQEEEPLRNGCSWEERAWLGFPVCGCPWAGQDESTVPTSECSPIGESPDPDGGLDCGCEDVRQYKIRGFAPYPYGDLNFFIADGGLTQVALDLRAEVTFRMPENMNPPLEGEWIREAADDPEVTGIFPVIGAPESESAVRYAVSKGKVVVGINAGYHVSESLGAVGQVGMNEYNAGKAVCQEMLRMRPDISHMHGIPYEYSNFAHFQRLAGCLDYMRQQSIAVSNSTPGLFVDLSDTTAVGNFIQAELEANPAIDALYPTTAFLAPGVLQALSNIGKTLPVGTIDILTDTVQQIDDGLLLFSGDQQFHIQGYFPAMLVALYKISGSKLKQHTLEPGPFFVTGSNPGKEACTLQPWTEELVGSLYAAETRLSFPACQFKPPQDCIPGYELSRDNDCVPCAAGFFKSTFGQTPCSPCGIGTYSTGGNATCPFCPVGRYGSETRQSECTACSEPFTTEAIARTSNESCVCQAGFYGVNGQYAEGGSCLACIEAMSCPLGSHNDHLPGGLRAGMGPYPTVDYGFMTLASEPFEPYKCLVKEHCPGGAPGSCAMLRRSNVPGCATCEEDAHERNDECVKCEGTSILLPTFILLFVAIFGTACITLAVNRDVYGQTNGTLMIVVTAGLLITGVQSMGVFSELQLEWFEPMRSIFQIMTVFSLDLEIINIACVLGSDNAPLSYGVRQLGVPFAVLVIAFATLLMKKYAPLGSFQRPQTALLKEFINTVGTILNVFFISVMISAVAPFTCYKHPGPGDRWSVTFEPGILCGFSGEHVELIAWGCMSLGIICIPYMALAAYGTWIYTRSTSGTNAPWYLGTFRFLFFRYHPHRYYYGVLFLLRSVLICLAPVLIRDDTGLQVAYLVFVILAMMQVQQTLYPWRLEVCNIIDGVLNNFLVLLLLIGALLSSLSLKTETLRVMGTVLFLTFVVGAALTLAAFLWIRLRPRQKYDSFLCHHKAHASAQVRLVKILLQMEKGPSYHVFIDSDDLRDLDELFDTVKSNVAHFVVFLTSLTLTRPWCAGEIAVATMCNLLRSKVVTSSFRPASNEELMDIESFIGDVSVLQQYEISAADVQEALLHICHEQPEWKQVLLGQDGGVSHRFRCVALELTGHANTKAELARLPEGTSDAVIISTDPLRDEALATGAILYRKLIVDIYNICEAGLILLPDHEHNSAASKALVLSSRAVLIILHTSLFDSVTQVDLISASVRAGLDCIIPVMCPAFVYPSAAEMTGQLATLYPPEEASALQDSLQSFCKRIAYPMAIHSSEAVLLTQIDAVRSVIPNKRGDAINQRKSKESYNKGSTFINKKLSTDSIPKSVSVPDSAETGHHQDAEYDSDVVTFAIEC